MQTKFLCPMLSAFDDKGEYDYEANDKIIENLIKNEIDGIVIFGSSGEFFAFSLDEKKKIIEHTYKKIDNRVQFIVGTGSMSIDETIELSKYCQDIGVKDIMVITPYYFSLSDDSIYGFYKKLAENVSINIYIYNFPDRTGYNIDANVVLRLLSEYENIVGYKDSSSAHTHIKSIITEVKSKFPEFIVYTGVEDLFLFSSSIGGNGSIGALSNIVPEICSLISKAFNNEDFENMILGQRKLSKLTELYSIDKPFMPVFKKAMILRGMQLKDNSFFPFRNVSNEKTAKIQSILQEAERIK
ncbi:MAG: dihydrodipicolinate synthase family protein [Tissierellaceae bacterium]|jgi:4-hydroxy-tetrahydrodipicolinate synthase